MTKFSQVVRFVNTNHPDRRDGLLKTNLEGLDEDDTIFQNSIHDYYQDRPMNTDEDDTDWDDMELSEFVSSYNIAYKSSTNKERKLIKLQNNRGLITKREKSSLHTTI